MSEFSDLLNSLPPVFTPAAFESLDSTNDELVRRALKGAPEYSLVYARQQTRGRGRRGRTWHSNIGNLYCSFLLRPDVSLTEGAKSSFVASLAVHSALDEVLKGQASLQCKWPNDVLIDGAKVSGLLLECQGLKTAPTQTDWIVIGIGINLLHAPEQTPYPATCLANHTHEQVTSDKMLAILSSHFHIWVERWKSEGFESIRTNWLQRAKGLGEKIRVNLPQESLTGTFEDLDQNGSLVLRTDKSVRLIQAGDVFFNF